MAPLAMRERCGRDVQRVSGAVVKSWLSVNFCRWCTHGRQQGVAGTLHGGDQAV